MILLEKIKNPQIKKNERTYIKDLALPNGWPKINRYGSSILYYLRVYFPLNFVLNCVFEFVL
jgi:hypothetical protein